MTVALEKHNARLLKNARGEGKGGDGAPERGEGKGKCESEGQMMGKPGFEVNAVPSRVAASGIARPARLNFFLGSQHRGLGTATPCYYNIRNLVERLNLKAHVVGLVTYHNFQMYNRAAKIVGQASPSNSKYHVDVRCTVMCDHVSVVEHNKRGLVVL